MATDSATLPSVGLASHDGFPLVTVIIRTYRGDWHLLNRALTSVICQDLDDSLYEVVITNDGPADDPDFAAVIDDLPEVNFPLIVIGTDRKYGYYCISSNLALAQAQGHYIAHLDADNEWLPDHLSGLLKAIRTPGADGWPHFVYARRRYVRDHEVADKEYLYEGDSAFVEWTKESMAALLSSPMNNFIDSSDFLIGRGTLYELSERTGYAWSPEVHRYGDWEIATRFIHAHFRGRAVDQVTQIYHWTGKNLQATRKASEVVMIPQWLYDEAKKRGALKEDRA